MNIGFCTFAYPQSYRDRVSRGIKSHKHYCSVQNYSMCDDVSGVYASNRKANWSKLPLLVKYIGDKFDWLVWVDSDTIIANPGIRLEELLLGSDLKPEHEMLWIRDPRGSINSGTFFVRCSDWCADFLTTAYNNPVQNTSLCDQAAMIHLYGNNYKSAYFKVHIENRTWKFNAYPVEKNSVEDKHVPEIGLYHQGDFLCHFLGMNSERLDKGYLKRSMDGFDPSLYPVREPDIGPNLFYQEHWDEIYGKDRPLTYINSKNK